MLDSITKSTTLRSTGWVLAKIGIFACLVVIGIEIGAKFFLSHNIAVWRAQHARLMAGRQVYFYTPRSLQNHGNYPIYRPNSDIELKTYFPDAHGKLTLEYECMYRSDNLGFVSNERDFRESEILVLGDSFTVGLGGCDWLSGLDENVKSKVYAAAHPGIGPVQWRDIVMDLEKLGKIENILIILITDDMFRRQWRYSEAAIACMDLRSTCADQIHVPITDNMDRVLAERSLKTSPTMVQRLKHFFPASVALVASLKSAPSAQLEAMKASVDILKGLSAKHKTKIIWVSEWREVVGSLAWTGTLARALEGLDVHTCRLPAHGFAPRDRHPNAKGYSVLRNCVEAVIKAW